MRKTKMQCDSRSASMAELYREGKTFAEIGVVFDLDGERVRQLILQDHGMTGRDGGRHKKTLLKKERRLRAHNEKCVAIYGCNAEQFEQLRGDPLEKFANQKAAARRRGIGWDLTHWQWWTIWQESGKWASRGRGQGYVMCRKGDIGPYAVGNVFIGLSAENSSEGRRKNSSLPVGVRKNRWFAGYSAARCIDGIHHHLGTFPNPELAREAYLSVSRPVES